MLPQDLTSWIYQIHLSLTKTLPNFSIKSWIQIPSLLTVRGCSHPFCTFFIRSILQVICRFIVSELQTNGIIFPSTASSWRNSALISRHCRGYLTGTSAWFEPFEVSLAAATSVLISSSAKAQELAGAQAPVLVDTGSTFLWFCTGFITALPWSQNVTVKSGDWGGKKIDISCNSTDFNICCVPDGHVHFYPTQTSNALGSQCTI